MGKTENLGLANLLQVQTDQCEKYIFLAIIAYWITGILIFGYVLIYSSVPIPEEAPFILLASYLIGISLIVFQSCCRNVGLSLLFTIFVACVPLVVGVAWLFPLLAVGFTVVAWLLRRDIGDSIGRVGLADIAALMVVSCTFAVITLTSRHDADFFLLWNIYHTNNNVDPLMHSAITTMIKNYGVMGIGLDGFVTVNYHVFSHFLRAAISFGTGLPVITSYGAMQLIVSEPLLLLIIVAAAETVRPSGNPRGFFIRIVVLFVVFHSIKVWPVFAKFALWDSYATSDSYAISLILMLSTICAMRIECGGYRLITLVVLALLTTASKISTGTICVAIVATHLALFDPSVRIRRYIAGIGMIGGWSVLFYFEALHPRISKVLLVFDTDTILRYGLFITITSAMAASTFLLLLHRKVLSKYAMFAVGLCAISFAAYLWRYPQVIVASNIQKLYFLRTYAGLSADSSKAEFWIVLGQFTLVHFFFTWMLVVLAANLYFWDRDKARYLWAPLLYSLVALGISWLVLFFTNFHGGAEYYFSNVAMFIALPYLLTILSEQISGRKLTQSIAANIVPFVVLATTIVGLFTLNCEKGLVNFMSAARDNVRIQNGPGDQHLSKIIEYLEEIQRDSSTKHLGVYIAKEEKDFWGSMPQTCDLLPFIIPVVSERPGLLALPDHLKCPSQDNGYADYRDDAFEMSGRARITHEELLKLAIERGFDGYVDLRAEGWTVYRNDALAKRDPAQ